MEGWRSKNSSVIYMRGLVGVEPVSPSTRRTSDLRIVPVVCYGLLPLGLGKGTNRYISCSTNRF